jgi:hypothetical protein
VRMVAAAATTAAPRYAPPDPTLPHPWKALVDGNTGYIYYWNPDTNVTQYDKPLPPPSAAGPPPPIMHVAGPPPSSSVVLGTSLTASVTGSEMLNGHAVNGHLNGSNGFQGSSVVSGSAIAAQQPKLAAIPMPRVHQVFILFFFTPSCLLFESSFSRDSQATFFKLHIVSFMLCR